jgi:hypothetical protein
MSAASPLPQARLIRLRYAGTCRLCNARLPVGVRAWHDPATRTVVCGDCASPEVLHEIPQAALRIDAGTPGASARRLHQVRRLRRERRTRDAHPWLGGLILALTRPPQREQAWASGAMGEESLGKRLNDAVAPTLRVLHDRRITGTRANIDHIVVCPNGVLVIDAKRYVDQRPTREVRGGILTPRVEHLRVGGRRRSMLVDGMHRQTVCVAQVLAAAAATSSEGAWLARVPVHGMLCFLDADWPVGGGPFAVQGIQVLWPGRAVSLAREPGPMGAAEVATVHQILRTALRPA